MKWVLEGAGDILTATAVFSLFAVPPGYVAGWLAGLFDFRRASLLRQVAIAIPLSIATLPIVVYLPWRFLSIRAVWALMFLVWAAFLVIVAGRLRRAREGWHPAFGIIWTAGLLAAAGWTAIALLSLPDMAVGPRLYYPVPALDYLSRVPMVSAISRQTTLPALSPFLNPGRPVPLLYHYFWPMVCGLADAAGRGTYSARDAAIAGTIWAGIALLCVIALFLRFFQDVDPSRWRVYAIGMALLGVTGLDIIPVLVWDYQLDDQPELWLQSVEWWNDQVTGWVDAMIWVPHHVAALVATLLAFLILWNVVEKRGRRYPQLILAALCLASAAGMSVYVIVTMAVFLVVWALVMAIQSDFEPLAAVAVAGTLSLVLAAPFLMELRSAGTQSGVEWTVRQFWFLRSELSILELGGQPTSSGAYLYRLLFLPLNYLMELGAFFCVGVIFCRRIMKTRPVSHRDLAALAMLGTSVFVATFLTSRVGGKSNDLGWRSFMPAQFILLLWAAQLFGDWKQFRATQGRLRTYGMVLLLLLGVSSTLFDLVLLRFFPVFIDAHSYQGQVGERTRALADTYAWIRGNTPEKTVVQPNPFTVAYHYGLHADRGALAIAGECDAYSGETEACLQIKRDLRPLFNSSGTAETFATVCRNYPLDLIVVDTADRPWAVPESWVWHVQPVFVTRYSKVFACHPLLR